MSKVLVILTRRRWLSLALMIAFALVAGQAAAAQSKLIVARATGVIIAQDPCGPTLVCQTTVISGQATQLGPLTGILHEQIDTSTGNYTGTAVFTTANGDISTAYTGLVTPPDASGNVVFFENHVIVGGTGRYKGATGRLGVVGTATAAGELSIQGVGILNR
jgi:hypothetical protein